ncbi:hypothetical protein EPN96_09050 [bacterium]|nr:MAG: hypothetical protein EPN96_09050 [bacterium]
MTFKKYSTAIFAALLAALVLAVFWQTTGFELINLDDLNYTVLHSVVKEGLTFSGIKEVFTSIQFSGYMPVTLLSYMADVEFFGLKPSGFHFTNTFLHLLNTLLLFAFLYRATGSGLKSFFAAALWAIHPLRAESVAWVAERKDVLAGFFFLAGLLSYCEYAKSKRPVFYVAALVAMLLGLLSKSILVVFPLVLLILDFWPLERFKQEGGKTKKLLIEKIPFLALSALFSVLSFINQKESIYSLQHGSVFSRIPDIPTSYLHYLKETLWPVGLFMEDRHTTNYLSGVWALGAGLLIIALTFLVWRFRKTIPAVTAGWFWYLVILFPVSGVVPLDFYLVADHFTYLPHIGLMVAAVWGTERLYSHFLQNAKPLAIAGGVIAIVLAVLCFQQVSLWRDELTLFSYVDKMSGGKNAHANKTLAFHCYNDALAHYNEGKYGEAYDELSRTLLLDPYAPKANGHKGIVAANLGRYGEAAELLRKELEMAPGDRDFSTRLANILILGGDLPGAARQGLENIRRWPDDKVAWQAINYLGGEEKARMLAGR